MIEMLSKKNLWFLTLFSIILVMAIYYVSTPNNTSVVSNEIDNTKNLSTTIDESDAIKALRINRDEALENEVSQIKEILMDASKSTEEKSDAYEALKELNVNKGKEETLEELIKKNFNYENFAKIDGTSVKIVVDSKNHSYELANKIMNTVQDEFDNKVYITVSFEAE